MIREETNQYSSRTVPGGIDVIGSATNAATVTVNGQFTYRKNDYYWLQLAIANGGPVYQSVTNTAALSQGSYEVSSNTIGNVFVPPSTESFSYDPDGNLLTDGRWTYTWDAENRLSTIVARTAVGPQQSIRFEYDSKGRRIGKKVWSNTTFAGTPVTELKFLYDGWNLVATLNSGFALQTAFIWGLDLSGSVQGAGGVGGLLEINDSVNGPHFPCYDGNGNVTALASAADGTVSAKYEYGPFGEVIRSTGPMAKANPFRFSTKYQDNETDLLYYGYRYEKEGRWLSRDPLEEQGFRTLRRGRSRVAGRVPVSRREDGNLYALLRNDPLNDIDLLGLCDPPCKCGEDVTPWIYQSLQDIADAYTRASWWGRIKADWEMFGPDALNSWDIWWLKYMKFQAKNWDPVRCPQCWKTVMFEGLCVNLDELNYIMYGWGIQVCDEDRDFSLETLEDGLWARALWDRLHGNPYDTGDVIGRKVGFAEYGSDFSGRIPSWLAWPHDCALVRERVPRPNVTDWRWVGLRDKYHPN